jgi:hypothetical protein
VVQVVNKKIIGPTSKREATMKINNSSYALWAIP